MHRVTPTIAQNSCKICPVANYATTAAWTDLIVCHRILALGLACLWLPLCSATHTGHRIFD